jgi:galactose mutarotase-like enzyme
VASDEVQVRAGSLRAVFLPARGGRMVSLRDDDTGREWLVQRDPKVPDPAGYGDSFTARHIHGWDEMLPTIEACRVGGVDLPDHGEVWAVPWTRRASTRAGGLRLEVVCREVPLTLTREVWPEEGTIVLDYSLTNHGGDPVPALWAAHPQLRISATRAEFHPAPTTARVVAPATRSGELGWDEVNRAAEDLRPGTHLKVWLDGPNPPRQVTLRGDSAALTLRWSGSDLGSVAVLWDNQAFSTERVLAVEPSTGRRDSLADALAAGDRVALPAGRSWQWRLRLWAGQPSRGRALPR